MDRLSSYTTDERPWGSFVRFTHNEPTTVKIIRVKSGEAFSLQYHDHRNEFWHIISGSGTAIVGGEEREVGAGDELFIENHQTHRMTGGPKGVVFLEIAFGDFDEGDITRLEDKYGRD